MNITNIVLIIISILTTVTYCIHVGWKQSISATAADCKDSETRSPKFFWWFIIPLTTIMGYVANKPIFWAAALILETIGLFTGYNINFFKKKIQDIIHVACVYIAIALFWIGLTILNLWTLVGTIPIILIIIWYLKKKPKYYTYKIELWILVQIWITFLILNM